MPPQSTHLLSRTIFTLFFSSSLCPLHLFLSHHLAKICTWLYMQYNSHSLKSDGDCSNSSPLWFSMPLPPCRESSLPSTACACTSWVLLGPSSNVIRRHSWMVLNPLHCPCHCLPAEGHPCLPLPDPASLASWAVCLQLHRWPWHDCYSL